MESHEPDRDVFICHASEDKDAVARPLALELRNRGWTVWFDEFELTLGDSLRQKIDSGLAQSRYGVVVLSPAFFQKDWPQRELDGLVARETGSGEKVVLPIWHGVDAEYVARFSPTLAGKLAASSQLGAAALAEEIERVLLRGGRPTAPSKASGPSVVGSGTNPTLDAIMAQNEAALREVLRRESTAYSQMLESVVAGRSNERPTHEIAAEVGQQVLSATERYTTQLLALLEHYPDVLERELRALARRLHRRPESGYAFWSDVRRWAVFWLTHVLGAYAVRRDAFPAVRILLSIQYVDPYGNATPLTYNFVGDAGALIGQALAPPPPGQDQSWIVPTWEHLVASVNESEALRAGWPEIFEFHDDPRRVLGEWSFIQGLGLGLVDVGTVGYWNIVDGVADLARALWEDRRLRERLAREAFGISLEELDAQAEEALSKSRAVGSFPHREAARIFVTGGS